jgi:FkbM family methyltransferase
MGLERARLPNGLDVAFINRAELDFLYEEIFVREVYLKHGLALADGACVVDAGANIGLFSLWAATRARGVRLHAVEPIPEIFAALLTNAARHFPRARLHRVALGAVAGQARFAYYPRATGWSTRHPEPAAVRESLRAYLRARAEHPFAARIARHPRLFALAARPLFHSVARECQVTTLSGLMHGEPLETIDLLKIDVEGAELDVLSGIADASWPRIRQVTMECDSRTREPAVAVLGSHGFDVVAEQSPLLQGTAYWHVYAQRR